MLNAVDGANAAIPTKTITRLIETNKLKKNVYSNASSGCGQKLSYSNWLDRMTHSTEVWVNLMKIEKSVTNHIWMSMKMIVHWNRLGHF